MSGTPSHVTKGRIIRAADRILSNPDRAERLKLLADLVDQTLDRLSKVAVKSGAIKESDRPHADNDWFGQGSGWWPKLENKELKMRYAYIHAETIALGDHGPARPVRTFWCPVASEHTFLPYVHDTKTVGGGVEVFWITPPVPIEKQEPPSRSQHTKLDLWVIGTEAEVQAIRDRYPTGYTLPDNVQLGHGLVQFRVDGW